MAEKKSLEAVLAEYFNPKTEKVKGEAKFIMVVNGSVITERVKNKKELEKVLKSMAIEDARVNRSTEVLIYSLDGKANTSFDMAVDISKDKKETTEEGK